MKNSILILFLWGGFYIQSYSSNIDTFYCNVQEIEISSKYFKPNLDSNQRLILERGKYLILKSENEIYKLFLLQYSGYDNWRIYFQNDTLYFNIYTINDLMVYKKEVYYPNGHMKSLNYLYIDTLGRELDYFERKRNLYYGEYVVYFPECCECKDGYFTDIVLVYPNIKLWNSNGTLNPHNNYP